MEDRIAAYKKAKRDKILRGIGYSIRGELLPPSPDYTKETQDILDLLTELDDIEGRMRGEVEKTGRVGMTSLSNMWSSLAKVYAANAQAESSVDASRLQALSDQLRMISTQYDQVRHHEMEDIEALHPEWASVARSLGGLATGDGSLKAGASPDFVGGMMDSLRKIPARDQLAFIQLVERESKVDMSSLLGNPERFGIPAQMKGTMGEFVELAQQAQIADKQAREREKPYQDQITNVLDRIRKEGVKRYGMTDFVDDFDILFGRYPWIADSLGIPQVKGENEGAGDRGKDGSPTASPYLADTRARLVEQLDDLAARSGDPADVYYQAIVSSPEFKGWVQERGYEEVPTDQAFRMLLQERRWTVEESGKDAGIQLERNIANGNIANVPARRVKEAQRKVAIYDQIAGQEDRPAQPSTDPSTSVPETTDQNKSTETPPTSTPASTPAEAKAATPAAPKPRSVKVGDQTYDYYGGTSISVGGQAIPPNKAQDILDQAALMPGFQDYDVEIDGRGYSVKTDGSVTETTGGKTAPMTPEQVKELRKQYAAPIPQETPKPAATPETPVDVAPVTPPVEKGAKASPLAPTPEQAATASREAATPDQEPEFADLDQLLAEAEQSGLEADQAKAKKNQEAGMAQQAVYEQEANRKQAKEDRKERNAKNPWSASNLAERLRARRPDEEQPEGGVVARSANDALLEEIRNTKDPARKAALRKKYEMISGLAVT